MVLKSLQVLSMHAFELDRKNGNNLWKKALEMEMYNIGVAFEILEDGKTGPAGYTKVSGHLIWSVNMDFTRSERIASTTPGAEPPGDAKDSGSARPHSTHLETSSTNRP